MCEVCFDFSRNTSVPKHNFKLSQIPSKSFCSNTNLSQIPEHLAVITSNQQIKSNWIKSAFAEQDNETMLFNGLEIRSFEYKAGLQ